MMALLTPRFIYATGPRYVLNARARARRALSRALSARRVLALAPPRSITYMLAGADSLGLLAAVVADLAADGWRVQNVDCTVVAQRPRLAHHRAAMRTNLAQVLGVERDAVSVKATTTDHLGAIGRGEGIACTAVCTVVR